ncbi:hypothetical protein DFH06DRAFT_1147809 [Mycena polygramma]|nr:hypothetical protein DFH06DRAFT_1147809 [Mycena polygramma]
MPNTCRQSNLALLWYFYVTVLTRVEGTQQLIIAPSKSASSSGQGSLFQLNFWELPGEDIAKKRTWNQAAKDLNRQFHRYWATLRFALNQPLPRLSTRIRASRPSAGHTTLRNAVAGWLRAYLESTHPELVLGRRLALPPNNQLEVAFAGLLFENTQEIEPVIKGRPGNGRSTPESNNPALQSVMQASLIRFEPERFDPKPFSFPFFVRPSSICTFGKGSAVQGPIASASLPVKVEAYRRAYPFDSGRDPRHLYSYHSGLPRTCLYCRRFATAVGWAP